MSSAGGGTGVGGGTTNIQLLEGTQVQLGDTQVDLKTAEGVAQAEALLNLEQLAELEGLMRQAGYKRVGNQFVPSDDYAIRKELGIVGPKATDIGLSELDSEIGAKVFEPVGLPNPYNSNTTEKLYDEIKNSPTFNDATGALTTYLSNPTAAHQAEFVKRFAALDAEFPRGNIMETLFLVFRESIKETNEDKKYYLVKLQEFNTMAGEISEYLSYMVDQAQKMEGWRAVSEDEDKDAHQFEVRKTTFDLSTVNAEGKAVTLGEPVPTKMNSNAMQQEMKNIESMQETVRNKREMATTAFTNFDQKSTQLYTLMSNVLKTINEMRSSTTRNML